MPLYGIPENELPPAPWSDRPLSLDVLVSATELTWGLAVVVAVLALGASLAGRARLAATLLVGTGAAGTAAVVLAIVTTLAWRVELDTTPVATIFALLAPTAAAALGIALAAVVRAHDKRPLLD